MTDLRYVLLSDGSSDRALMPILTWILREKFPDCAIQPQWGDLGRPIRNLAERIRVCVKLYDCDLLFVHRDAEAQSLEGRQKEIQAAILESRLVPPPVTCCVVPVRMQEAWLLFDEKAIRKASGNPNGSVQLSLPALADLERLSDPKKLLHQLLREASGLSARRMKRLDVRKRVHRVPLFIDDFGLLRCLSAFLALEEDVAQVARHMGDPT